MLRLLGIACVAYMVGSPAFDGYRPGPLDRAMKSFHMDLNAMSRDTLAMANRAQHGQIARFVSGRGGSGMFDRFAP
jgi:hypothetical protein